MKINDNKKAYFVLFLIGMIAGILCRLTDFLPYEESLWSLPSIATLFGFWIASVGIITCLSSSNKSAFINSFLYMFGMTISFYGLKYILGFYISRFSNEGQFQTDLFIVYSILSVACGIGSFVLYFWNRQNVFNSFLYALPASGMLAEAVACLIVLYNGRMLLAQTILDIVFGLLFGIGLYRKAYNKLVYIGTVITVAVSVFLFVYKPFLLTV